MDRAGTAVAVIDTGIPEQLRKDGWLAAVTRNQDLSNVDLLDAFPPQPPEDPLAAVQQGKRPPRGDGYLDYAAGHGNFAAGVIAQVAPDADIRMYRVLDSDGMCSEVDVACAILQAVDDGAQVINLSLGTQTADDLAPIAMSVALEMIADRPDVVLVAAAGNYGDTRPSWPAAFPRVIGVAALQADGLPAPWSSSGFWVRASTVGEGVISTYVPGRESPMLDPEPETFKDDALALWSGTSFAAPQVAGKIAQVASTTGQPAHQVAEALLAAGRPVPGYGQALQILPGT